MNHTSSNIKKFNKGNHPSYDKAAKLLSYGLDPNWVSKFLNIHKDVLEEWMQDSDFKAQVKHQWKNDIVFIYMRLVDWLREQIESEEIDLNLYKTIITNNPYKVINDIISNNSEKTEAKIQYVAQWQDRTLK